MISETMKMISIIIPAYNEEGNIQKIYLEIVNVMKNMNYRYEIIFINDGSIDNTEKAILDLAKVDEKIKLISFSRNFGHMPALMGGYNHCKGDAAITMDCDLQHPPEMLRSLIKKWEEGYDIVNTKRNDNNQKNFFKKLTSKYFYKIFSWISNFSIEEGTADFRLTDKKVVEKINELTENDLFLRGMLHWLGFKSTFITYTPNERYSGTTKYSLKKMVYFAISGLTSFSIIPLKLATISGFLFSGVAFLYLIFSLYSSIILHNVISGWTSVIVSVLFLGGVQLISIGILGEYIGKIFIETKNRPRYVIKLKEGL